MNLSKKVGLGAVLMTAAMSAFADGPTDVASLGTSIAFVGVGVGILAVAATTGGVLVTKRGAKWVLSMINGK